VARVTGFSWIEVAAGLFGINGDIHLYCGELGAGTSTVLPHAL
jgi:hypothetical protein